MAGILTDTANAKTSKEKIIYILVLSLVSHKYIYIPVVPHKAVAEVSKIGNL